MNESEFENELRALRPLTPPTALEAGIARDLAAAPSAEDGTRDEARWSRDGWTVRRLFSRLGWALGGAAVASVIILSPYGPRPSQAQRAPDPANRATASFLPTESSRELVGAENGGLLYDENHAPSQVLRYSSLERHTWANPSTGARLEVEVPREDVVLVPVSFQ